MEFTVYILLQKKGLGTINSKAIVVDCKSKLCSTYSATRHVLGKNEKKTFLRLRYPIKLILLALTFVVLKGSLFLVYI